MPPKSDPKKTSTVRALQTKLQSFLEMFDDICDFVNTLSEVKTASLVTVRLEKMEDLWDKVNDVILEIQTHEDFPADDRSYSKERSVFGKRYYEVKSVLLDKIKAFEESTAMNSSLRGLDATLPSTIEHVRLPQIKLQTFDGNIDEWLSFRDLYTSLIHLKLDLPDVEKFHYLKGCLEGEAKALIDSLAITAANYKIAWDTITKRYNDSKLLKRRQVQALSKLSSLAKESASELQSLLEGFERIVQTLDQLVEPADYRDLLLLDVLCSRLDPITRRGWEECSSAQEKDTVKDLTDFLQRRIRVLRSLPCRTTEARGESLRSPRKKLPFTRASHTVIQEAGGRCVACSEMHLLYQCPIFKRMKISTRDKLLRNHSLCRNCFKRGHQATDCSSRYSCRHCKGKHHTMVCFKSNDSPNGSPQLKYARPRSSRSPAEAEEGTFRNSPDPETVSSNTVVQRTSSVLLATAIILIEDDEGGSYPARALLDSGSECNLMTEKMCQLLSVQRKRANVFGIGQANTKVKHKAEATVRSRVTGFSQKMEFLILPKVTANLPTMDVETAHWELPDGKELADPAFFRSKTVDMVLGIDHFFNFFATGRKIQLKGSLPTLTETVFGWVVTGMVENQQMHCNVASSIDLNVLPRLREYKKVEAVKMSKKDQRCNEQDTQGVRRGSR